MCNDDLTPRNKQIIDIIMSDKYLTDVILEETSTADYVNHINITLEAIHI